MSGVYGEDFVEELRRGAQSVAPDWGISPDAKVDLLNLSENATFRVKDPQTGGQLILRVHRPGYHTSREILSELAWIDALRTDGVVETPAPLLPASGDPIATFDHKGDTRHVVAFAFMPGTEPDPAHDMASQFEQLGAINARLHAHAKTWERPEGFTRKTWDFYAMLGPSALWGDWRQAPGLSKADIGLLEQVADTLADELEAYGMGPERFGLVHADLRLANLLIDGGRIGVIDFDDCGFSWFGYDFASAVSFLEHEPYIPALRDAWLKGYRQIAPFPEDDAAMLPCFVMLRRLLLTAWVASHAETETAQELGEDYVQGTVTLGRNYLSASPGF